MTIRGGEYIPSTEKRRFRNQLSGAGRGIPVHALLIGDQGQLSLKKHIVHYKKEKCKKEKTHANKSLSAFKYTAK